MIDFNIFKEIDSEIKISLEDEGLTFDQAVQITCNSHSNNVNVTMKVGFLMKRNLLNPTDTSLM